MVVLTLNCGRQTGHRDEGIHSKPSFCERIAMMIVGMEETIRALNAENFLPLEGAQNEQKL